MKFLVARLRALTIYDWIGLGAALALTIMNVVQFSLTPRLDFAVKGTLTFAWMLITILRPRPTHADVSARAILVACAHTLSINLFQPGGGALAPALGWALVYSGIVLVLLSWLTLGTSFAILPALRTLRTRGPYAWVRHPIYLSYFTICLGSTLLALTPSNLLWLAVVTAITPIRIELEEKALARAPDHEKYRQSVRYKWLPGIY